VDPDRGRYWLFLERVIGAELTQVGDLEQWKRAAVWLACFHASSASVGIQPDAPGPWIHYDARSYRRWVDRARAFHAARPARRREETRFFGRLAASYEGVVDRLLALSPTLIHGEFYASNIIVGSEAGEARICPVDWETTAIGPALVDLAALTAGKWSEAERTSIALAYYEASASHSTLPVSSVPRFLESLAVCRLHLAVLGLGWAQRWEPPRHHRFDWLGEARQLADELGL
jgi:aminoglycoside/choline kinase family phosphotransferase